MSSKSKKREVATFKKKNSSTSSKILGGFANEAQIVLKTYWAIETVKTATLPSMAIPWLMPLDPAGSKPVTYSTEVV